MNKNEEKMGKATVKTSASAGSTTKNGSIDSPLGRNRYKNSPTHYATVSEQKAVSAFNNGFTVRKTDSAGNQTLHQKNGRYLSYPNGKKVNSTLNSRYGSDYQYKDYKRNYYTADYDNMDYAQLAAYGRDNGWTQEQFQTIADAVNNPGSDYYNPYFKGAVVQNKAADYLREYFNYDGPFDADFFDRTSDIRNYLIFDSNTSLGASTPSSKTGTPEQWAAYYWMQMRDDLGTQNEVNQQWSDLRTNAAASYKSFETVWGRKPTYQEFIDSVDMSKYAQLQKIDNSRNLDYNESQALVQLNTGTYYSKESLAGLYYTLYNGGDISEDRDYTEDAIQYWMSEYQEPSVVSRLSQLGYDVTNYSDEDYVKALEKERAAGNHEAYAALKEAQFASAPAMDGVDRTDYLSERFGYYRDDTWFAAVRATYADVWEEMYTDSRKTSLKKPGSDLPEVYHAAYQAWQVCQMQEDTKAVETQASNLFADIRNIYTTTMAGEAPFTSKEEFKQYLIDEGLCYGEESGLADEYNELDKYINGNLDIANDVFISKEELNTYVDAVWDSNGLPNLGFSKETAAADEYLAAAKVAEDNGGSVAVETPEESEAPLFYDEEQTQAAAQSATNLAADSTKLGEMLVGLSDSGTNITPAQMAASGLIAVSPEIEDSTAYSSTVASLWATYREDELAEKLGEDATIEQKIASDPTLRMLTGVPGTDFTKDVTLGDINSMYREQTTAHMSGGNAITISDGAIAAVVPSSNYLAIALSGLGEKYGTEAAEKLYAQSFDVKAYNSVYDAAKKSGYGSEKSAEIALDSVMIAKPGLDEITVGTQDDDVLDAATKAVVEDVIRGEEYSDSVNAVVGLTSGYLKDSERSEQQISAFHQLYGSVLLGLSANTTPALQATTQDIIHKMINGDLTEEDVANGIDVYLAYKHANTARGDIGNIVDAVSAVGETARESAAVTMLSEYSDSDGTPFKIQFADGEYTLSIDDDYYETHRENFPQDAEYYDKTFNSNIKAFVGDSDIGSLVVDAIAKYGTDENTYGLTRQEQHDKLRSQGDLGELGDLPARQVYGEAYTREGYYALAWINALDDGTAQATEIQQTFKNYRNYFSADEYNAVYALWNAGYITYDGVMQIVSERAKSVSSYMANYSANGDDVGEILQSSNEAAANGFAEQRELSTQYAQFAESGTDESMIIKAQNLISSGTALSGNIVSAIQADGLAEAIGLTDTDSEQSALEKLNNFANGTSLIAKQQSEGIYGSAYTNEQLDSLEAAYNVFSQLGMYGYDFVLYAGNEDWAKIGIDMEAVGLDKSVAACFEDITDGHWRDAYDPEGVGLTYTAATGVLEGGFAFYNLVPKLVTTVYGMLGGDISGETWASRVEKPLEFYQQEMSLNATSAENIIATVTEEVVRNLATSYTGAALGDLAGKATVGEQMTQLVSNTANYQSSVLGSAGANFIAAGNLFKGQDALSFTQKFLQRLPFATSVFSSSYLENIENGKEGSAAIMRAAVDTMLELAFEAPVIEQLNANSVNALLGCVDEATPLTLVFGHMICDSVWNEVAQEEGTLLASTIFDAADAAGDDFTRLFPEIIKAFSSEEFRDEAGQTALTTALMAIVMCVPQLPATARSRQMMNEYSISGKNMDVETKEEFIRLAISDISENSALFAGGTVDVENDLSNTREVEVNASSIRTQNPELEASGNVFIRDENGNETSTGSGAEVYDITHQMGELNLRYNQGEVSTEEYNRQHAELEAQREEAEAALKGAAPAVTDDAAVKAAAADTTVAPQRQKKPKTSNTRARAQSKALTAAAKAAIKGEITADQLAEKINSIMAEETQAKPEATKAESAAENTMQDASAPPMPVFNRHAARDAAQQAKTEPAPMSANETTGEAPTASTDSIQEIATAPGEALPQAENEAAPAGETPQEKADRIKAEVANDEEASPGAKEIANYMADAEVEKGNVVENKVAEQAVEQAMANDEEIKNNEKKVKDAQSAVSKVRDKLNGILDGIEQKWVQVKNVFRAAVDESLDPTGNSGVMNTITALKQQIGGMNEEAAKMQEKLQEMSEQLKKAEEEQTETVTRHRALYVTEARQQAKEAHERYDEIKKTVDELQSRIDMIDSSIRQMHAMLPEDLKLHTSTGAFGSYYDIYMRHDANFRKLVEERNELQRQLNALTGKMQKAKELMNAADVSMKTAEEYPEIGEYSINVNHSGENPEGKEAGTNYSAKDTTVAQAQAQTLHDIAPTTEGKTYAPGEAQKDLGRMSSQQLGMRDTEHDVYDGGDMRSKNFQSIKDDAAPIDYGGADSADLDNALEDFDNPVNTGVDKNGFDGDFEYSTSTLGEAVAKMIKKAQNNFWDYAVQVTEGEHSRLKTIFTSIPGGERFLSVFFRDTQNTVKNSDLRFFKKGYNPATDHTPDYRYEMSSADVGALSSEFNIVPLYESENEIIFSVGAGALSALNATVNNPKLEGELALAEMDFEVASSEKDRIAKDRRAIWLQSKNAPKDKKVEILKTYNQMTAELEKANAELALAKEKLTQLRAEVGLPGFGYIAIKKSEISHLQEIMHAAQNAKDYSGFQAAALNAAEYSSAHLRELIVENTDLSGYSEEVRAQFLENLKHFSHQALEKELVSLYLELDAQKNASEIFKNVQFTSFFNKSEASEYVKANGGLKSGGGIWNYFGVDRSYFVHASLLDLISRNRQALRKSKRYSKTAKVAKEITRKIGVVKKVNKCRTWIASNEELAQAVSRFESALTGNRARSVDQQRLGFLRSELSEVKAQLLRATGETPAATAEEKGKKKRGKKKSQANAIVNKLTSRKEALELEIAQLEDVLKQGKNDDNSAEAQIAQRHENQKRTVTEKNIDSDDEAFLYNAFSQAERASGKEAKREAPTGGFTNTSASEKTEGDTDDVNDDRAFDKTAYYVVNYVLGEDNGYLYNSVAVDTTNVGTLFVNYKYNQAELQDDTGNYSMNKAMAFLQKAYDDSLNNKKRKPGTPSYSVYVQASENGVIKRRRLGGFYDTYNVPETGSNEKTKHFKGHIYVLTMQELIQDGNVVTVLHNDGNGNLDLNFSIKMEGGLTMDQLQQNLDEAWGALQDLFSSSDGEVSVGQFTTFATAYLKARIDILNRQIDSALRAYRFNGSKYGDEAAAALANEIRSKRSEVVELSKALKDPVHFGRKIKAMGVDGYGVSTEEAQAAAENSLQSENQDSAATQAVAALAEDTAKSRKKAKQDPGKQIEKDAKKLQTKIYNQAKAEVERMLKNPEENFPLPRDILLAYTRLRMLGGEERFYKGNGITMQRLLLLLDKYEAESMDAESRAYYYTDRVDDAKSEDASDYRYNEYQALAMQAFEEAFGEAGISAEEPTVTADEQTETAEEQTETAEEQPEAEVANEPEQAEVPAEDVEAEAPAEQTEIEAPIAVTYENVAQIQQRFAELQGKLSKGDITQDDFGQQASELISGLKTLLKERRINQKEYLETVRKIRESLQQLRSSEDVEQNSKTEDKEFKADLTMSESEKQLNSYKQSKQELDQLYKNGKISGAEYMRRRMVLRRHPGYELNRQSAVERGQKLSREKREAEGKYTWVVDDNIELEGQESIFRSNAKTQDTKAQSVDTVSKKATADNEPKPAVRLPDPQTVIDGEAEPKAKRTLEELAGKAKAPIQDKTDIRSIIGAEKNNSKIIVDDKTIDRIESTLSAQEAELKGIKADLEEAISIMRAARTKSKEYIELAGKIKKLRAERDKLSVKDAQYKQLTYQLNALREKQLAIPNGQADYRDYLQTKKLVDALKEKRDSMKRTLYDNRLNSYGNRVVSDFLKNRSWASAYNSVFATGYKTPVEFARAVLNKLKKGGWNYGSNTYKSTRQIAGAISSVLSEETLQNTRKTAFKVSEALSFFREEYAKKQYEAAVLAKALGKIDVDAMVTAKSSLIDYYKSTVQKATSAEADYERYKSRVANRVKEANDVIKQIEALYKDGGTQKWLQEQYDRLTGMHDGELVRLEDGIANMEVSAKSFFDSSAKSIEAAIDGTSGGRMPVQLVDLALGALLDVSEGKTTKDKKKISEGLAEILSQNDVSRETIADIMSCYEHHWAETQIYAKYGEEHGEEIIAAMNKVSEARRSLLAKFTNPRGAVARMSDTPKRVFDFFFGDYAPMMRQLYLNPAIEAESLETIAKEGYIKLLESYKLNKEQLSYAAKAIDDGKTLDDVKKDRPEDGEKIYEAMETAREIFEEVGIQVNMAERRNGLELTHHRANYTHHGTNRETNWFFKLIGYNRFADDIPTSIAGKTGDFTPIRKWSAAHLERHGDQSNYDLMESLTTYLSSSLNTVYQMDNIVRMRQLVEALEGTNLGETREKGSFDYDQNGRNIGTRQAYFKIFLNDLANTAAGKAHKLDRVAEEKLGRNVRSIFGTFKQWRTKALLGANMKSAMSNVLPLCKVAAIHPIGTFKAFGKTFASIFGYVDKYTGALESSLRLRSRSGFDAEEKANMRSKVDKALLSPFELVDTFATKILHRVLYEYEVEHNGLSSDLALGQAEQMARDLQADKTRMTRPDMYNSRIVSFLLQFTQEAVNDLQFTVKDMPKYAGRIPKAVLQAVFGYLLYSVFDETLNGGSVTNLYKAAKDAIDNKEEGDSAIDVGLDIAGNAISELNPFDDLTGEGLSGVPTFGGIIDIAESLVGLLDHGDTPEEWEQLGASLLGFVPYGYQARRTATGITDVARGYSTSSDGSIKYGIDQSPLSYVKAGIFGSNSLSDADEYYHSNYESALSGETEIEKFEALIAQGIKPTTAIEILRNGTDDAKTATSEAKEIRRNDSSTTTEVRQAEASAGEARSNVDIPNNMTAQAIRIYGESENNVMRDGVALWQEYGYITYPTEFDTDGYEDVGDETLTAMNNELYRVYTTNIGKYKDAGKEGAEKLSKKLSEAKTRIKKKYLGGDN